MNEIMYDKPDATIFHEWVEKNFEIIEQPISMNELLMTHEDHCVKNDIMTHFDDGLYSEDKYLKNEFVRSAKKGRTRD